MDAALIRTELKVASEQLAHLESQRDGLLRIIDLVSMGLWETDLEGNLKYANEEWCAMVGVGCAEVMRTNWIVAIHPDDLEQVQKVWKHALETCCEFIVRYRYVKPCGAVVFVITNGHCNSVGWVGSTMDITDLVVREGGSG